MTGTVHVPLHQLPAALQMSSAEWESCYDVPRPRFDDWIIMHSRVNKRAMWAAQLAKDAGFKHCLVYDKVKHSLHIMSQISFSVQICQLNTAKMSVAGSQWLAFTP